MPNGPEGKRTQIDDASKDADLVASQKLNPDPRALPLVDYGLVTVSAEAEKREKLLSSITVDKKGVAHCASSVSNQETLLAAVRIDDEKNATAVPLKLSEKGFLAFELPDDKPVRIGFFVGYRKIQQLGAVLRMGLYPGVPLTTQSVSDRSANEIMYGLNGFSKPEIDEGEWAEQIGLFTELGFNRSMCRGMFDRSHKPLFSSNTWQERPLVVAPDDIRKDLLAHFPEEEVTKDEFNILFYGTEDKFVPTYIPERDDSLSLKSLGGDSTKGVRGGIGIGFGEPVARQAQTKGVDITSLEGAFRIKVVPTNS